MYMYVCMYVCMYMYTLIKAKNIHVKKLTESRSGVKNLTNGFNVKKLTY